jgi:hypothetical protein
VEEAEMRLVLEMSLMSVEAGESMGKWWLKASGWAR